MKKIFLVLSLITLPFSSYALEHNPTKENKHQEFLAKKKAIESESHQGRIEILKTAEACIKNAKNRVEYKTCEQTEQSARKSLKEQTKAKNEALKNEIRNFKIQNHQKQI